MYKIIKKTSYLIRTFILVIPNLTIFGLTPMLTNIFIIEPTLHLISFATTGIFIVSGKTPSIGSVNYLVNYWIFVLLLYFSDWLTKYINVQILMAFIIISIIYISFYVKVINSILILNDF